MRQIVDFEAIVQKQRDAGKVKIILYDNGLGDYNGLLPFLFKNYRWNHHPKKVGFRIFYIKYSDRLKH